MTERRLKIVVDQEGNAKAGISSLIGGFGGLAAAAGVVIGGLAAVKVGLIDSVGAAMEAQDGQAELQAVLKSTGGIAGVTADMANNLASSLQNVTKFSDDAILSGENMLLTFTRIGADVFPEATGAMLDLAQKFGSMDQASVMLGKALNDPIQGVTALRRVGIQFTDAQEKAIEGMMKWGDIAGAQRVILAEVKTQVGGLAEAAGNTLSGKLEILRNKFGDLQEVVGGAIIPALTKLATFAMPAVEKATNTLSLFFSSMEKGNGFVTSLAAGLLSLGMSTDSVESAIGVIQPIIDTLQSGGQATLKTLSEISGALQSAFSGNFVPINNLISDLTGASFRDVALAFREIRESASETFSTIQSLAQGFMSGGLFGNTALVGGEAAKSGGLLKALGLSDETIISIENFLSNLASFNFGPAMTQLVTGLSTALDSNWPLIESTLKGWSDKFWNWINGEGGALEGTAGALSGLVTGIQGWIDTNSPLFETLGETLGGMLIDGLGLAASNQSKWDLMMLKVVGGLALAAVNIIPALAKIGESMTEGLITGMIEALTGEKLTAQLKTGVSAAATGLNPFAGIPSLSSAIQTSPLVTTQNNQQLGAGQIDIGGLTQAFMAAIQGLPPPQVNVELDSAPIAARVSQTIGSSANQARRINAGAGF